MELNNTHLYPYYKFSKDWEKLSFLPLPIVAFVLNFFLLVTTTINRKKLERQNNVYLCVISMLLGNILFILLHVWHTIDTYIGIFDRTETEAKTLWALCQAAIVSIQTVMAGNLGSLLYVVLDSTYFVGRSVNRKASGYVKESKVEDRNGTNRRKSNARRVRAVLLILLTWAVPISLVMAATVTWNCVNECDFRPHGFNVELRCNKNASCSRIWQPLRNDFLSLHAALWVFEVLGLIVLICSGIRQFCQVMTPPQRDPSTYSIDGRSRDSLATTDGLNIEKRSQISRTSVDTTYPSSYVSTGMDTVSEESSIRLSKPPVSETDSGQYRQQKRKSLFRLHSRISFMIVLSATFFACSFPSFVTYLLDASASVVNFEAAMTASFVAIYIYLIFCPIVLLKYLPYLKSALISMVRNCACTRMPRLTRRHSITKTLRISQPSNKS